MFLHVVAFVMLSPKGNAFICEMNGMMKAKLPPKPKIKIGTNNGIIVTFIQ